MKAAGSAWLAAGLLALSSAAGIRFQDPLNRVGRAGTMADERVIAQKDSPYTHMSWVVSEGANQLELYFFDVAHGGVCLNPPWQPPESPAPEGPNPGSLNSMPYVDVFPLGVLLNRELMRRAGGDAAQTAPNILIIGLGAGSGVSILAEHFPQASMTVVDIDSAVIDSVLEHYPMLRWLESQKTGDGRPRLALRAMDGRSFIRRAAREGRERFDLVILDAYALGFTVPPHLMTEEFYRETAACLNDGGIVLSNIAASFTGRRRVLLSGAVRSMKAAGLSGIAALPVYQVGESNLRRDFSIRRNVIVLASRSAIDFAADPAAWLRASAFVPYPDLAAGRWVSRSLYLVDSKAVVTSKIPVVEGEGGLDPLFLETLSRRVRLSSSRAQGLGANWVILGDRDLINLAGKAVRRRYGEGKGTPKGWRNPPEDVQMVYEEIDWVLLAREVFADAVRAGSTGVVGVTPVPSLDPEAPLFTDQRPNADLILD